MKFVLSYRSIIERVPLQTYAAALVFCPTETEISRQFRKDKPQCIKVLTGVGDAWDSCLQTLEGHDSSINAVAFSPDGTTLVSASIGETVRLWDAKTGVHRQTLPSHGGLIYSIALSPDGTIIALGFYHGTLELWDAKTGTHRQTLEGHDGIVTSVAFSPDGTTILSASNDETVRVWDAKTGVNRRTIER